MCVPEVRWCGSTLNVDGAAIAEVLGRRGLQGLRPRRFESGSWNALPVALVTISVPARVVSVDTTAASDSFSAAHTPRYTLRKERRTRPGNNGCLSDSVCIETDAQRPPAMVRYGAAENTMN